MNAGIEDWLSTTLGAVVVPEKGREVPAHDSDLPFIGMEHVESNTGRITSFGNSGKIRSASPVVVQGDVLYGRLRPYLNKVTIAPSHAYTSGEFIVFRGNAQIDARFLCWRLTAQDFVDFACTLNTGDRPRVKWPQMADFSLLLPPMDEQRRIVDIVEDHLSRLDAAKMLTQQGRLRLATWRRAVVDSAFWHSDLIPEAKGDELIENLMRSRESRWPQSPSGKQYKSPVAADLEIFRETQPWPVVSLESATDPRRTIRYGILKPAIGQGGTVRYVEVRDLAGNTLKDKTFRLTSSKLDEQFSASRLAGGDVVIAVRGSYERTAVVPKELNDANLSRDVARLAPLPELLPELLHYWLQTSSSKAYLNRHARGVAVKGVNISTLRAMPVPLLPLDIQRRIVDTVNTQLAAGDRTTLEIDQAAKRSGKLRRSLLAAAFAGRLTGQATDMEIVEEMTSV